MSDDCAAHTKADSPSNTLRLVPVTPPQLLGLQVDVPEPRYIQQRTSLLLPALKPRGNIKGRSPGEGVSLEQPFQHNSKAQAPTCLNGSPVSTTHRSLQPCQNRDSVTGSPPPNPRPKPLPKKRLQIHKDSKTFSLLQDDSQPADIRTLQHQESLSPSPPLKHASDKLPYPLLLSPAGGSSDSTGSCESADPSALRTISTFELKQASHLDPSTNSPWNYRLVGGLRKVPKSPDPKQRPAVTSEGTLAQEISDDATSPSHCLSAKPSFQSTNTASTNSENSNYKVYGVESASSSETALLPLSSGRSNDQPVRSLSPTASESRLHRTTSPENENYRLHGDQSPSISYLSQSKVYKYSQESLLVLPLIPRNRRSNEKLGYYKSRSRESLQTGSPTSLSTILSQQEVAQAVAGSGSLIEVPTLHQKLQVTSSWAPTDESATQPPRSHMNEHPHQWSSQLSTVHSVSDAGTDRGSGTWSDDNGRRSSGFPSTPSRHSRQMLSISSSLAQEDSRSRSRSDSIEPPQPTYARNGLRHLSNSSIRIVGDQDEYGDGITDMLDLRTRPSRSRLSGFFSVNSTDNGRTNTMISVTSSRANSLLASSIPTWARLYYGSGERRYLGAPGSSTEGTDSRASSFRSGSPNTDHFPLSIYSPRRRPRELNRQVGGFSTQESLDITPAPQLGSDGRLINDPYSRRFRTWSMSSVWSPHLRVDRRATRQSVWEPPSLSWSTEGSWFSRRNLQVLMFIGGFIFPLAWMVGAVYPLPHNPSLDTSEREQSSSNLENSNVASNDYARQYGGMDSVRYESARWWRILNRWMSLVGLLIIAAVITLVVVGMKQGW